jgi:hypothetical protein
VQALHLALLVRRVRCRRVDVDAERQRGLLDRRGGELEPVVPPQPARDAAEQPALGVDEQRVAQRGQDFGRRRLQRESPNR